MAARVIKFQNDILRYTPVGLDSMCFIYQFADDPTYAPLTHHLFTFMEQKKISTVTSIISVIESTVLPEKVGDQLLLSEYEKIFLNLPGLTVVSVDWPVGRLAAKLRAKYPKVRVPDAVQLSASLFKGCRAFVTNDEQLKQVSEIKMFVLKEYL